MVVDEWHLPFASSPWSQPGFLFPRVKKSITNGLLIAASRSRFSVQGSNCFHKSIQCSMSSPSPLNTAVLKALSTSPHLSRVTSVVTDASSYRSYPEFCGYIIHRYSPRQMHMHNEDTTLRRLLHYHGLRFSSSYHQQVQLALQILRESGNNEDESIFYQSGCKDKPVAWISNKVTSTEKALRQLQENVKKLLVARQDEHGGAADEEVLAERQKRLCAFEQR